MLCTGHAGRYPQELKVTIKPRVSARVRCGVGAFALAGEKGWDSLGERAIVEALGWSFHCPDLLCHGGFHPSFCMVRGVEVDLPFGGFGTCCKDAKHDKTCFGGFHSSK